MRRCFLWLLLLFPMAGPLAAPAAEIKKITTIEGITEYRLDNGMIVLLFPDRSRESVTVNLTIFVGSRHEGYGETGMAHLLEHMVFKGTPTHKEIPKLLANRGAQFNGTTWLDRTNYFETLKATDDNLEFAIKLEADRMMNSLIRREDLLSEFSVVRSEFERGENSPSRILSQRMLAAAFEWHNYGKSTIGNRSDIERVPVESLREFYKKYYQPDNAMLVVAGRFEENQALALIVKYFGPIPKPARELPRTYTEEPPQDGERTVTLRRVGESALVGAVYKICAGPHPDYPAVAVLNQLLTDRPSGRLYKALVETKKAASVSGSAYALHDPGVIEFEAQLVRGVSPDEVRDLLLKTVEDTKNGVTEEEVARARKRLLTSWEDAFANSTRIAISLSEWAAQGDWRLMFLHRDRLEKVTAADVKRVAERYLQRNNRTVGMFLPTTKPERIEIPATPSVAKLLEGYKGREGLAQGEAFEATPANIEARTTRSTLPNGTKVAVLPKKTRGETVTLELSLHYGTEESLKPYVTAATFLPSLMNRGTKKLTYQELRDALDREKTRISVSGGLGEVGFSLETRQAHLPAALDLLRQIMREPALLDEELEILKRHRLANLDAQKTDPQAIAVRALQRRLSPYAPSDVRYIATFEEEIERVKAVTGEQVRKLYAEFVSAQVSELAIVGDFDPGIALPVLEKALAGWISKQPYARIQTLLPQQWEAGKQTFHTPDKANAVYVAGLLFSLSDSDPAYAAMILGNYIFGGGSLSSRLGDRIRQKEGLSYGVGSQFHASSMDPRGTVVLFAICNPLNMSKVEKAIAEEMDLLLKNGITPDELERAKKGYLESQRLLWSRDSYLASQLCDQLHQGRTMSFLAEHYQRVESATVAEVNAALRKYLDPKRLVIVTAGDFEKKPADGAAPAERRD